MQRGSSIVLLCPPPLHLRELLQLRWPLLPSTTGRWFHGPTLLPLSSLPLGARLPAVSLVQALVLENGQSIRVQNCPPQPGFCTMPVHSRPTVNAEELNRAEFPVTTQEVISIPDPGSPVPRAWQQWPRLHMTHRGGAHRGWGQHPCQQLWRQHLGMIQVVALGTIIQWGWEERGCKWPES